MKIQTVRFKNLNSLQGEWLIDFTDPHFTSSGIFAIVGTTGAGKTTILDAISLALYGRTPRLKQISKSSNEVMSRHSGECFAEVEFQSVVGSFRVHWHQHKARRSPSGELQPPRHEFVDGSNQKVMATKLKDVAEEVLRTTGMNFEQFTRSMLLAQGDFSKFLQASSDERAPILEQITGTDIYSRISIQVHQCKAEEDKKLEFLKAELAGLNIPSVEEISAVQENRNTITDKIALMRVKIERTNNALTWRENLHSLHKKKTELDIKKDELERIWKSSVEERQQLEKAEKASQLHGVYSHLEHLRREQTNERKEKTATEEVTKTSEKDRDHLISTNQKAQQKLGELKIKQQETTIIITKTRQLDYEIIRNKEENKRLSESLKSISKEIALWDKKIHAFNAAITSSENLVKKEVTFQKNHPQGNILQEQLPRIEEKAQQLIGIHSAIKEQQHSFQSAQTILGRLAREEEEITKSLSDLVEEKNSLEEKVTTEKTSLKQLAPNGVDSLYKEIQDLKEEQYRNKTIQQLLKEMGLLEEKEAAEKEQQVTINTQIQEFEKEGIQLTALHVSQQNNVKKQEQLVLLTSKIVNYEKDRERLSPDTPCPLCGSTTHPYRSSTPPTYGPVESQLAIEKELLAKLEKRKQQLQMKLNGLQIQLETSEKAKVEISKRQDEIKRLLESKYSTQPTIKDVTDSLSELENQVLRKEELVRKAEVIIATLLEFENRGKDLTGRLEKQSNISQQLQQKKNRLEAELQLHLSQTTALKQEHEKLFSQFNEIVSPHIIGPAVETHQIASCLEEMQEKVVLWKKSALNHQEHQQKLEKNKLERDSATAALGSLENEREKQRKSSEQIAQLQKSLQEKRVALFGNADPDQIEKAMQTSLRQQEETYERLQKQLQALEKQYSAYQDRLQHLTQSLTQRATTIEKEEVKFSQNLAKNSFPSEESFLHARLDEENRKTLRERFNSLEKEMTETSLKLKDVQQSIEEEKAKKITEEDLEQLGLLFKEQNSEFSDLQQQLGALNEQLTSFKKNTKNQEEKQKLLELQQKECSQWAKLHSLIGSADGKKFRNFAQGLTFELMVNHANKTLEKMSDRYLLRRTQDAPLELTVIDAYQAGEFRSTANLSGGETFIVSLALALGLSSMASRKVQIDSLFLDEGFGTLDEESLEVALDTLSTLQQRGKTIGIISHVPLLKERIDVQLRLEAGGNGRSKIFGPGVQHLSS